MSSKQKHRGQHEQDARLFSGKWIPLLRQAVEDASWLATRGYSENSFLKIVGDRYRLNKRQRKALYRGYCSDQAREKRLLSQVSPDKLVDQSILIDGYNLLITIESGLGGGKVFECRDTTYRDIASIHGTYRRVEETRPALHLIGDTLAQLGAGEVKWLLDSPVSNSGRLKKMMYEIATGQGYNWEIELVNNPDKTLEQMKNVIVISSDGPVLSRVEAWCNLHKVILQKIPGAEIVSLRSNDEE